MIAVPVPKFIHLDKPSESESEPPGYYYMRIKDIKDAFESYISGEDVDLNLINSLYATGNYASRSYH